MFQKILSLSAIRYLVTVIVSIYYMDRIIEATKIATRILLQILQGVVILITSLVQIFVLTAVYFPEFEFENDVYHYFVTSSFLNYLNLSATLSPWFSRKIAVLLQIAVQIVQQEREQHLTTRALHWLVGLMMMLVMQYFAIQVGRYASEGLKNMCVDGLKAYEVYASLNHLWIICSILGVGLSFTWMDVDFESIVRLVRVGTGTWFKFFSN